MSGRRIDPQFDVQKCDVSNAGRHFFFKFLSDCFFSQIRFANFFSKIVQRARPVAVDSFLSAALALILLGTVRFLFNSEARSESRVGWNRIQELKDDAPVANEFSKNLVAIVSTSAGMVFDDTIAESRSVHSWAGHVTNCNVRRDCL